MYGSNKVFNEMVTRARRGRGAFSALVGSERDLGGDSLRLDRGRLCRMRSQAGGRIKAIVPAGADR